MFLPSEKVKYETIQAPLDTSSSCDHQIATNVLKS
jgi:hypothetical protein